MGCTSSKNIPNGQVQGNNSQFLCIGSAPNEPSPEFSSPPPKPPRSRRSMQNQDTTNLTNNDVAFMKVNGPPVDKTKVLPPPKPPKTVRSGRHEITVNPEEVKSITQPFSSELKAFQSLQSTIEKKIDCNFLPKSTAQLEKHLPSKLLAKKNKKKKSKTLPNAGKNIESIAKRESVVKTAPLQSEIISLHPETPPELLSPESHSHIVASSLSHHSQDLPVVKDPSKHQQPACEVEEVKKHRISKRIKIISHAALPHVSSSTNHPQALPISTTTNDVSNTDGDWIALGACLRSHCQKHGLDFPPCFNAFAHRSELEPSDLWLQQKLIRFITDKESYFMSEQPLPGWALQKYQTLRSALLTQGSSPSKQKIPPTQVKNTKIK